MWICLPRACLSFVCPNASLSWAAAACQIATGPLPAGDGHNSVLAQSQGKAPLNLSLLPAGAGGSPSSVPTSVNFLVLCLPAFLPCVILSMQGV